MTRSLALLLAVAAPAAAQTLPDAAPLDRTLERHVVGGLVDYAGLQANRAELDYFLEALGRTSPVDLDRASRDERLAFWINAYTTCALRLVIDGYPIRPRPARRGEPATSVRHLAAWGREFCRVAQGLRSLDGIADRIVRPLGEPRAEFALSCPARSCPGVPGVAYRGERLDAQLDAAVRAFAGVPRHYEWIGGDPPVARLAPAFERVQGDLGGRAALGAFLARYAPTEHARALAAGEVRIEFLPFDWTLNDLSAAIPAR
jgi:hypothetical protein